MDILKNDSNYEYFIISMILISGSIIIIMIIIFVIIQILKKKKNEQLSNVFNNDINIEKELSHYNKKYMNKIIKHKYPTILVAICSYRDPELCVTMIDAYKKAMNPSRIHFAIVQQNNSQSDDPMCFAENTTYVIPSEQIRIMNLSYKLAKGPTYARHLLEYLWNNEDYYLMSDSHIRFEPAWDVEILHMLSLCDRPNRTIITMYPAGFERMTLSTKTNAQYSSSFESKMENDIFYRISYRRGYCYEQLKSFEENGIVLYESICNQNGNSFKKPQYVPMYSAGFAFSHSDIIKEIPFPSNTHYLFFGEELLMSARAFTHGWDLKGPTHSIVYHLWSRDYRKVYYNEVDNLKKRNQSIKFIKNLLLGKIKDPICTFGTKRTMKEFWNYIGVDFENKTFTRSHRPWKLPKDFKPLQDEYSSYIYSKTK